MVQDDAEDQHVQLLHDEVQQGHGKLRAHAQEDPDHDGKLLGHDGEGQLDGVHGEGGGQGHCGAEPGDEAPENR